MTEQEWLAIDVLVSRAKAARINNYTERTIHNPAEILASLGVATRSVCGKIIRQLEVRRILDRVFDRGKGNRFFRINLHNIPTNPR